MTVPPVGKGNSRFVDGSHPLWLPLLPASKRKVGTEQAVPTGYEVMQ